MFKFFPKLVRLNLSNTMTVVNTNIMSILNDMPKGLKFIDLSYNNIRPEHITSLKADIINTDLEILDISYNNLSIDNLPDFHKKLKGSKVHTIYYDQYYLNYSIWRNLLQDSTINIILKNEKK